MAPRTYETPVLIVGAGPVGLCMAIDLDWRGVDCLIVELRPPGQPPEVKCNHTSARTMEALRRLGVSEKVRNAGLPADYPNDSVWSTTVVGQEFARLEIPCRADRYTDKSCGDGWWPTPEPPHRINQLFLEPVLFEHAASLDHVTILNRTRIDSFTQDEDGVRAEATDLATGEPIVIHSRYIVGCDGGRSLVRKQIGAKLSGVPVLNRTLSTHIRAPQLDRMINRKRAWMNFAVNPRRNGCAIAIDGKGEWLLHTRLVHGETDFSEINRDQAIRDMLGVGADFEYEVLNVEDWTARRLIADKFREGRAFLCGDAAHLWIPVAGYGMNAGIADALDLSWQMAAVINGWAPGRLLQAYQSERQPITEQVSVFAMNLGIELFRQLDEFPAEIEDQTPAGDAARASYGQAIKDVNFPQFFCAGLNFGYYYADSPVIAYDGQPAPIYRMETYTPSTVPGCRLPHLWLEDGRSLYDPLGPEFTLLRFDRSVDTTALTEAAARAGVPLATLDVDEPAAAELYPEKLVLSRPDRHVAWRGNQAPANSRELFDLVRGAA